MSETSVDRALAIFETFARERRPLSLKDLSDACHMPASTCHALVQTLLRRAWLAHTGRGKDLYPTRRLHDLGAVILAHDPVLSRLEPAMAALRDATRETVILGQRERDRVLYLAVLEGPQVVRYSARAGETKPLHSSAIGKALLSVLNPSEARALLASAGMAAVTGSTLTDPDRLLADLAAGREAGCFTTRGENVPDVTAFALPLAVNNQVYGLAVAGPGHRMDANGAAVRAALAATCEALLEQGLAGHC